MTTIAPEYQGPTPKPHLKLRTLATGLAVIAALGGCATQSTTGRFVNAAESQAGQALQGELNGTSPVNLNNGARYSSHWVCGNANTGSAYYQLEAPFAAQLALFNDDGRMLDDANSPSRSEPATALLNPLAGECRLLVINGANATAFGPYELTPQPFESAGGDGFTPGQAIQGTVEKGQQTLLYPFDVEHPTKLDLRLLDATRSLGLVLKGDRYMDVAQACGDAELRLTGYLEAGSYQLELVAGQRPVVADNAPECTTALVDQGRAYRLESQASRLLDGMRNGGPLDDGDEITGVLTSGKVNEYSLTVTENSEVTIGLESDDFDTVLAISGPNTELENDDTDAGTNSQLSTILAPGDYRVRVKSHPSSEDAVGGQYRVRASIAPFSGELRNSGPIRPGETLMGVRTTDDNRYTLEVTELSEVSIALNSSNFDALLEVSGNGVVVNDDDSGGNTNALVSTLLEPGTYTLVAGSYGGNGMFTLGVELSPMNGEMRSSGELRPGDEVNARLESGHILSYELVIESGRQVRIDAGSGMVDTLLYLRGNELNLVDDDGGENSNSRIEQHLEPGRYQLEVRSYESTGSGMVRVSIGE